MAVDKQTLGAAIGIIGVGGGSGIAGRVTAIENKIPAEASSTNKLADKAYVNDAIENSIGPAVSDWLDDNVDPETGYVLDYSLSIQGAAADAKATGDAVADLRSAFNSNDIKETLLTANIPGTTQTVTFDSGGKPQSVVHAANNTAVRTDAFTWTPNSVTETRTLANGTYITLATNLITLVTVISDIQEVA